jgi:antitoxin VapB
MTQEIAMNLQIRDPRARELAEQLAREQNISMTDAVINALASELQRLNLAKPLADRLALIAEDLAAHSKPGGQDISREEIDAMWGHS